MKIIDSPVCRLAFISVDDQPGFIRRDRLDQGSLFFDLDDSEDAIKRKWKKKKRRQKVEEMPKGSI